MNRRDSQKLVAAGRGLTGGLADRSESPSMKTVCSILLLVTLLLSVACRQNPAAGEKRSGRARPLNLDSQAAAGREVFLKHAKPACSQCHTLKEAGAAAKIGTDLDKLKPDLERVRRSVTDGAGIMPSQAHSLTAEQIEAVAHYVAVVAGKLD